MLMCTLFGPSSCKDLLGPQLFLYSKWTLTFELENIWIVIRQNRPCDSCAFCPETSDTDSSLSVVGVGWVGLG